MSDLKKEIFLGLYLSGLKKDNSRLIVLERYKKQNKLVISKVSNKFKNSVHENYPDELLLNEIKNYEKPVSLCVNFPTTSPPCVTCKLKCPGVSKCAVREVKTLVRDFKKKSKLTADSKKHPPFPVPYVERAIDYYTAYNLEEEFPFEPAYALNRASLHRRGEFLKKRLKGYKFIECSTKVSLWRVGRHYKMRKSLLRNFYKDIKSKANREIFLDHIENHFFLYEDDKQLFLEDKNSFEALLCVLSGFLHHKNKVDSVPDYYKSEGLVFAIPR